MRPPVLALLLHAPALRLMGRILRAAMLMQAMHVPVLSLLLLSEPAALLTIIKGHEATTVVLLLRGITCKEAHARTQIFSAC
jgi:hypothetical protein